jgi:ADP-heptose:LPS heptosyltransferase
MMGYGDEIMGSGMARGAKARGKRIAFGNGTSIIWGQQAYEIFLRNPNVAKPGEEYAGDLQWIAHYRGHRLYHESMHGCARFNPDFRPTPGQIFFADYELELVQKTDPGFILIEPHVKEMSPNKQWPIERWQHLVHALKQAGHDVAQLRYGRGETLCGARPIKTHNFREALAVLSRAALIVTAEGGLHHGAACFGIPAVVIFGGHTHPRTTGYDGHVNLFVGNEPCGMGSFRTICNHCSMAMQAIGVDLVLRSALDTFREAA